MPVQASLCGAVPCTPPIAGLGLLTDAANRQWLWIHDRSAVRASAFAVAGAEPSALDMAAYHPGGDVVHLSALPDGRLLLVQPEAWLELGLDESGRSFQLRKRVPQPSNHVLSRWPLWAPEVWRRGGGKEVVIRT